jgi:hypothetical protein
LTSKPVVTVSDSLPSKLAATIFGGLTSKPALTVSPGLVLKQVVSFLVEPQNQVAVMVSRFGSQNLQLRFGDLYFKITATVSWFGPQN